MMKKVFLCEESGLCQKYLTFHNLMNTEKITEEK